MMNNPEEGQFGSEPIENRACLIRTSVIDDQYLEIARHLTDFLRNCAHYPLDSVLIVIRRKESGKRNPCQK